MALTVREAHQVNTLLNYLLGVPNPGGRHHSPDEVRDAAEYLAERAYKTLSAGVTGHKVRQGWPGSTAELLAAQRAEEPGGHGATGQTG